jgi:hypothetical protein
MRTVAQDFALVVAYTTGRITERVFRRRISDSEHGADAAPAVSGPSHCSPASGCASRSNGAGLTGKPTFPGSLRSPGNTKAEGLR